VVLKNGLVFLVTAVKHGVVGVIERVQRLKREKKKMTDKRNPTSKDKSSDKKYNIKDTAGSIHLKPANMIGFSTDMVNNPPHYASSKIECIDAMEAMTSQNREFKTVLNGHQMYCWQVIFKYIWRFPFKQNAVEDLKKAQFYLQRLINSLETKK
jgi:hypothetical protein